MKVCQRIRPRALPRIARPRLAGMILTASTICLGTISLQAAPQPSLAQGPAAAPIAPTAAAAVAVTGLVTIESDRQQADNSSGVITASGNVRITYPERRLVATARQAQYFSREGRLVLSGDVDVIDADGQRIRAERLVYRLDSGRLVASPAQGQQVYSRLRLQSGSGSPAPTLLP